MPRRKPEGGMPRPVKIVLYMLVMGFVVSYASFLARPLLESAGMSERALARLPRFTFLGGSALGLAMGLSKSVKEYLLGIGGAFLLGAVLWFFGVFAGGLLVGMGVSEEVADWIPTGAFVAGLVLGLVPTFVIAKEKIENLATKPANRK